MILITNLGSPTVPRNLHVQLSIPKENHRQPPGQDLSNLRADSTKVLLKEGLIISKSSNLKRENLNSSLNKRNNSKSKCKTVEKRKTMFIKKSLRGKIVEHHLLNKPL